MRICELRDIKKNIYTIRMLRNILGIATITLQMTYHHITTQQYSFHT